MQFISIANIKVSGDFRLQLMPTVFFLNLDGSEGSYFSEQPLFQKRIHLLLYNQPSIKLSVQTLLVIEILCGMCCLPIILVILLEV